MAGEGVDDELRGDRLDRAAGPDELQAMLRPAERELVAWPVATLVNNPRSQGPLLVEPVEVPPPG